MENKSMGGALVDVFDAGVSLIKSEITAITRRLGNIAKAKGLGVLLLLAALVPLTLALIFLILFVFYGLMRLGLGAWAAALILGLVSLAVTVALVFFALKKLGGEVPDDSESPTRLSDIAKDDLKYGSASAASTGSSPGPSTDASTVTPAQKVSPATKVTVSPSAHASSGTASSVLSGPSVSASSGDAHSEPGHTTGGHVIRDAPSPTPSGSHAGPQSTSTQGKPSTEDEQAGIPVSTHPTYSDDMKKEGY